MGRFASRIIIGFVAFTVIAQFLSPLAVLAEEEQPISTQIWPVPADSVVSATQSIEKTLEAPKLVSLDAAAASKSDKGPSKSNIVNLASAAATGNSVSSSMNNGTPISALESIASNNLPDIDQNTGALQYGFPLAVPKGRNGMQPNLTLKYNSSDKEQNSIFGYGWSIDIPYIQRLNKNGFEEMYYNSVNGKSFYSSIDGEIKSPSNTINGSYLPRMENGSFNKYSFSSSNNQWTVTAKDGTQYKFGYDANARQDGALPFSPFTANYKWMLQEIRDTNNNYITFSYYKDAGQIYPDAIKYTGSGSTDGVYEIDFLRTGRPDNVIGSYDTGFAVTSNYYINEIDVKVNGNWVTKYTLNYGMNSTNTRSLLNSITATAQAADGTVTALPAQTFAYQNSISSWAKSTSLALPHVRYTGNSDGSGEIKGGYERFVDLNADGLLDYVDYAFLYPMQYSDGTLSYYPQSNVYINQGNGWSQQAGWNLPADTFFKYAKADSGMDYQFSDLNGDGYPDLIESYIDYTSSSEAVKTAVYLNTGSGWSLSPNWTLPSYANSQYPAKSINGIFFSDINGDTLPDAFVTIANCDYRSGITCGLGTTIVYYNNGSGYYWYLNPWPSSLQLRPADLNTDSVPELNSMSYAANTAQSKIYHDGLTEWNRKLTVWNPYSSVSLDSFATSHNSLVFPNTLFADVDNDDRTDFVSYYIKPDILNKSIFVSGNKNNYLNGFS